MGSTAAVLGPVAVLITILFSLFASSLFGRNIGQTTCKYHVSFSPRARAFSIWSLIYVSSWVACLVQLASRTELSLRSNLLWSAAWLLCSVWVPLFSPEKPRFLVAAAVSILAAAACGTCVIVIEKAWSRQWELVLLTTPVSLLTGWLFTAGAINVAIAGKANSGAKSACVFVAARGADETESQFLYRRRLRYREARTQAAIVVSWVPLVLADVVAALSISLKDPVLALPLCWAILNTRSFPNTGYILSIIVLLCCAVVAALRPL